MSKWSDPERMALLRKLWDEGLSATQIARVIPGTTRGAVCGAAHRHKLPERGHRSRRPSARRVNTHAPVVRGGKPIIPVSPHEPNHNEVVVPETERKSILDLERDDCRWPIGDPQHADFHFCNGRQEPGQSYCAYHVRIAYAAPVPATRTRHAQPAPVANPVREMEDA